MSSEVDETDEKIIRILQTDSRRAFVEIANEIGLSESAVRRRVKNLVERMIIKRFTIEAPAITDINKCIDDIRKIEGVSDTDTVIILKTMR